MDRSMGRLHPRIGTCGRVEEDVMKARVGDRIVVSAPTTGGIVYDGEVLEVRGSDGAPPYVVRWSDSGNTGLFFPGADARVRAMPVADAPATEPPVFAPHVRSWRVDIDLFESGDETTAHAVLVAEAPAKLDAKGEARRNPADAPVPEIGDEVAVARALRRLADRLLETASSDITEVEGHKVTVSS
jgi:hypothetical protein